MVQLRFLTGKHSGSVQIVERFPCFVGRSAVSEVRIEEPGVWDQHFEIDLDSSSGFTLQTRPDVFVDVNGQRTEQAILRNGDLIEIGALKIQFWLNPTRQKSFRVREALTWTVLAVLSVGQVALVYWLPK